MSLLEELASRWPGESDEEFEESPWSTWPLSDEVSGPGVVPPMRHGSGAIEEVVALALQRGLTVYDPQMVAQTSPRTPRRRLRLPDRLRWPVAVGLAGGLMALLNKCGG